MCKYEGEINLHRFIVERIDFAALLVGKVFERMLTEKSEIERYVCGCRVSY